MAPVNFESNTYSVREGDNLVLKVVLGSSSNVDVTVGVMTSDGSATG